MVLSNVFIAMEASIQEEAGKYISTNTTFYCSVFLL